jgi:serine-type D-Ala-D-Ala carboxypeptidase/endopeptidase
MKPSCKERNRMNLVPFVCIVASSLLLANVTFAQVGSSEQLQAALKKRFEGDRTGLCVTAAVIEADKVYKASQCADPKRAQHFTDATAFEIGSITKTMLAYLVADLIEQGKMKLSDPIALHLPEGTKVPEWTTGGTKQLTIQQFVTHSTGLPPLPAQMGEGPVDNPYSKLTPKLLLASLSSASLQFEPGTRSEYSNFSMMVLSLAVTHTAKQDLEQLMHARLFKPLGMQQAYIAQRPSAVKAAQGHSAARKPVSDWTLTPNLGGVGMVRATLDDMVAYARAAAGFSALDQSKDPATARATKLIEQTQRSLLNRDGQELGMNWYLQTTKGGVRIAQHGGSTGGFSSYVAVSRDQPKRAVVILADTSGGGLTAFANSLLDTSLPPGAARLVTPLSDDVRKAMLGEYMLAQSLPVRLFERGGQLFSQAQGQGEIKMGYDSLGHLYALDHDIVLVPKKDDAGYSFTLLQGGGAAPMVRKDIADANAKKEATKPSLSLSAEQLKVYEGSYPLFSGLTLKVFEKEGKLMALATGQGAFPLKAEREDHFTFRGANIQLTFLRDASSKVNRLRFQQGLNDLTVERNP